MIYFLQAGYHIKIGYTSNTATLARRIASLQIGQPHKLRILRTLPTERWTEFWLHEYFAASRLNGEWFHFCEEMMTINPPSQRVAGSPRTVQPLSRSTHFTVFNRQELKNSRASMPGLNRKQRREAWLKANQPRYYTYSDDS